MSKKLTAREKRILKLVRSWVDEWQPGPKTDRELRLYRWIQRCACADAVLKILGEKP